MDNQIESKAKLVIIGAGIVGCSAAYHLTKLGWKDIVVVDQGSRPFYGGSSSHAPGGMFQTNGSKLMCELAQYGVDLYKNLEYDGKAGAVLSGGIELARTPERLMELQRRCVTGKSWGLNGRILTPDECKEKIPFLDERQVSGGYFVEDDGVGRPVVCVQAFADYVIKAGSTKFYDNVEVLGFDIVHNQINGVVTDKGKIECEHVLCCAGMWGPKIADMVGQPIPLQVQEHQYVVTEDIPELQSISDAEIKLPLVRDQDHSLYFRQHFGKWGIGNYLHRPIPYNPYDFPHPRDSKEMPSVKDFTSKDFIECWDRSRELFPCIDTNNGELPNFSYKINGMFSFTPDMGSYIGESIKVKGFWMAEAIWYLHAAGFGKIISEWMDGGEAPQNIFEADMNRFYPHYSSPKYVMNRGSEQYRVVYDILHPKRQMETSRGIARSVLYDKQRYLGANFFDTMGWERPQWYESNKDLLSYDFFKRHPWSATNWSPIEGAEALHMRQSVGLLDLSAFQIIEISGVGALDFLQYTSCSNIDMKVGRIVYTHFLGSNGGIECDVTVTRIAEDVFWIVSGVGSFGHDYALLKQRIGNRTDVTITSRGDEYSIVGIFGPNAKHVVGPMCSISVDIKDFKFFTSQECFIDEIPVRMFRLSYVGESGWEIYTKPQYVGALWEKLEEKGKFYNIRPVGLGAFDSMRIEKGYRGWGSDMGRNENPYQSGTDFVIHWKKKDYDFCGRNELEKIRADLDHLYKSETFSGNTLTNVDSDKTSVKLYTFKVDNPSVVMLGGETAYDLNGNKIGYVTSGNFGYSVNASIGYAYLSMLTGKVGDKFYLDYLGNRYLAQVAENVLYDPNYERIRL